MTSKTREDADKREDAARAHKGEGEDGSHIVGTDPHGQPVSDRVFTAANAISFVRLCMIPLFFVLLMMGQDGWATFFFGLAAATDFLDGLVARSTHTVSRLGQVLDPAVDRLLMVMGVIGAFVVGRLPLWVIVLVLARDLMMLAGGAYALRRYGVRVDVVYAGKFATAMLFFGLFGLLWNWPQVPGAGLVDLSWLPGWGAASASWGIWCVYLGIAVGVFTTAYYVVETVRRCLAVRSERRDA